MEFIWEMIKYVFDQSGVETYRYLHYRFLDLRLRDNRSYNTLRLRILYMSITATKEGFRQ